MNFLGFLEECGWSFDSTFQSQLVYIQLLATSKSGTLLLRRDQGGMVVFGHSRSTTLYASLVELINSHGNIMSIEDPIEFRMKGVNQIQVNPASGTDFPSGLGSIMRLDPDVILIGEIRDNSTATMAIDTALSGRLVLASMHGNDFGSSIGRLINLGVDPLLADHGLISCLAWRALDQLCPKCKEASVPDSPITGEISLSEDFPQFMTGMECDYCSVTGFVGRRRVFEVLAVDENSRCRLPRT